MVEATKSQTGAENVVWDLSQFYSGVDDPAIDADIQKTQAMAEDFAKTYKGKVGTLNAAELNDMMQKLEAVYDFGGRIESYADLVYSTDTNSPQNGALLQKVDEAQSRAQQELIFVTLEWNQADDGHVEEVLADPVLASYRHHLEAWRRYKPYQLSEAEEKVFMAKNVTGKNAWVRLFSQIMSAMRYDMDGEKLTQTEILSKLHEPDRETRRKASESITAGLHERSMELTYIFNVLAADKATDDTMHNYPNWIATRNMSNKAPESVVNALIETVTSNYDVVHKHYHLKRELLGEAELTEYDRYAPLPLKQGEQTYTWEEAKDIVLSAFKAFDETMWEAGKAFFDNNWIHAALGPNKRGGAYANPTVLSANPYVFMNYTGKPRDVATLAHELGHGIHMSLSARENTLYGVYTPLTTAEMASTFAEMLVFDEMMAQEPDPEVRLSMLVAKVEDSFSTIFRQVSMNRFEDKMHTARREQGELTTEQLSTMWLETQRAMFGDSVNLGENYGIWWSYVPHFLHTPGYVYAYAFGELLVLALYELYKEEGKPFAEKYIDVLAAGNSDYPDRILAKVGVDLNDPAFWQKGIQVMQGWVDQEMALAKEVYPEKFS